jgi:hypothetical protein
MRVTDFQKLIARSEGQKEEMSIAQISEVLRIVNHLLGGAVYLLIRKL